VKRKILLSCFALVLALSLSLVTAAPSMAIGPINAGGNSSQWEYGDGIFIWPAELYIGPSIFGIGTPTTIWEDDLIISVSAIPEAEVEWIYDGDVIVDCEYISGTILMWKTSKAWYEEPLTENAWASYKFWLNGSGPVTITRDDGVTTPTVENVKKFIFFKVQYVGDGMGNSDFDVGRNFDITIQAYK